MPYPEHYRLVWGGTLYGSEEFSCSLKIVPAGIGDSTPLDNDQALTDAIADIRTFWTTSAIGIPSAAVVTWVKLNRVGPDGRYVDVTGSRERSLSGTQTFAGVSTSAAPPQLAQVVTLRSVRDRGVLSRGRFFLPTAATVDAGGRLTVATQTALANAAATLVRNLNNWPGLDSTATVCLVSAGGRGAPDGGFEPVTRVEVGRVIDTQRRRRGRLAEQPLAVAL